MSGLRKRMEPGEDGVDVGRLGDMTTGRVVYFPVPGSVPALVPQLIRLAVADSSIVSARLAAGRSHPGAVPARRAPPQPAPCPRPPPSPLRRPAPESSLPGDSTGSQRSSTPG